MPELASTGTLLTIHNLAYLGLFWHWDMALTGSGLASLQLAAVGVPRQALLHEGGPGLRRHAEHGQSDLRPGDPDAEVRARGWKGCSATARPTCAGSSMGSTWMSGARVTSRCWPSAMTPPASCQGKAVCKAWLQRRAGLAERPEIPLFAQIGRLDPQKGWDLLAEVADRLLASDVQLVVLGRRASQVSRLARRPRPAVSRPVLGLPGLRRRPGPPDRGRCRPVPDAQPVRTVRVEPTLQPGARDRADRPGHRRPGRHRGRRQSPDPCRRHGQRLRLHRAHRRRRSGRRSSGRWRSGPTATPG